MITLIDNYDSFTYNLYHDLSKKDEVMIVKNDQINQNFKKIIKSKAIVISPGPSNPFNAGQCLEFINKVYSFLPILGVCLGHQILGVYFGAGINVLKKPMHGKVSKINLRDKCRLYSGIESEFKATRYHSLYLNSKNFPNNLSITSISNDDKIIMSLKHKLYPLYGVQYHPESIETKAGSAIINNFLNIL